jgi:tRNA modification GTPase
MGVARATGRAVAADLRLFLLEDPQETPVLEVRQGDLLVLGKADVRNAPPGVHAVSGLTGQGLSVLIAEIGDILRARAAGAATITRQRHLVAIGEAVRALELAQNVLEEGDQVPELVAAEVRRCVGSLEALVGRIGVEDYLGEIFSSFCIGK